MELTLAVIKPDGVMKGVVEEIKNRYHEAGLVIVREVRMRPDLDQVRELYRDHKGRFYFEGLVLSMVSGPCHVLILSGNDAVQTVRRLNGATNPDKAEPGTIRHDFKSAGGPFNTVHGSDSSEAYEREKKVLLNGI